MFPFLESFWQDENGAVTVDWVVLTAALVGMAIAVVALVNRGAVDTATGLGAAVAGQSTLME